MSFTKETPDYVLADYTQEWCDKLGVPYELTSAGVLVKIPALVNCGPDWKRFFEVASELRWASGWVIEGATLWGGFGWSKTTKHDSRFFDEVPDEVFKFLSDDAKKYRQTVAIYTGLRQTNGYKDLSNACIQYSRSLKESNDY